MIALLGIPDFWIWSAYLLCILATVGCVVYGVVNWNKGDDSEPTPEDRKWDREEEKVEEAL